MKRSNGHLVKNTLALEIYVCALFIFSLYLHLILWLKQRRISEKKIYDTKELCTLKILGHLSNWLYHFHYLKFLSPSNTLIVTESSNPLRLIFLFSSFQEHCSVVSLCVTVIKNAFSLLSILQWIRIKGAAVLFFFFFFLSSVKSKTNDDRPLEYSIANT